MNVQSNDARNRWVEGPLEKNTFTELFTQKILDKGAFMKQSDAFVK